MPIRMNRKIPKDTIIKSYTTIPLTFIPNKGQVDTKVKFYVQGTGYGFYFTEKEAVLSFSTQKNSVTRGVTLALQFLDVNPDVSVEGLNKVSGKVNYFSGKDQSKWITDLTTYEKIISKELWKGIDLIFYSKNNALKYDFILHPGASVEDIKLTYRGSNGISLDDEGNLQVHNDLGVLIDESPVSYQVIDGKRIEVESRFEIERQENDEDYFGFNIISNYTPDYSLVIDPGLVFSTFLGALVADAGTNEANKLGITVDNSGNVYVTGGTISPSFPVTLGAFQEVFSSIDSENTTAYVTKLSSDGSSLIYSTFLGGSKADEARSIAIDNMGNAYVTGETDSPDFPVTIDAFQEDFPSVSDDSDPPEENDDLELQQNIVDSVFVTKLNPDGSDLVYSTFLGGSEDDEGLDIAVDDMGNAYVTGETNSTDFPTTLGAFQEEFAGDGDDVFVTKLNSDRSALIYSTFLGGSNDDEGRSIAIDKIGNAYIGGETTSPDFPVTLGAFQVDFRADEDAGFVTKLNPDGSALIYSTFLNGTKFAVGDGVSGDNEVQGIAVDDEGNAYVAGFSNSPDFPVTRGAFQEDFQGALVVNEEVGFGDAFVAKLSPDGTILLYSTFLGGSADDIARHIAIDKEGNAYVVGYTSSSDFPVTLGAFDVDFRGAPDNTNIDDSFFDTFVAKINPVPLQ